MVVAAQLSVLGLYLPPVLNINPLPPPQMIISLPVQTAVCPDRASGALVVLVIVQVSSVQPPDGLAMTGSVYLALTAVIVAGTRILALAIRDLNRSLRMSTVANFRSTSTGLAKHSATTSGSFRKGLLKQRAGALLNSLLRTSGGETWWRSNKHIGFPPGFVSDVDAILAQGLTNR